MPDRSNKDKRRLLLDAAVRVFARKGDHAARVGDIAEGAGVAIDELLTGWVRGRLPYSYDALARAEHTVVEIVTGRLAPDHAGAPA